MTQLVKNRAKTLTEKQTSALLDEVQAAERLDKPFFDQGRHQKDVLRGLHPILDDAESAQATREARIVVNLVHAQVRSLLPMVFFREPTVAARPLNSLQAGKEETWELVLNGTLRRNGYKEQTKRSTLDALVYHEGWKKIAYITPVDEGAADPENDDPGASSSQTPRGAMPWGSKEMPVSMRVSPLNVIVDYLAPGRDPDHARFIAIKYKRPLAEMKADPAYTIPADLATGKLERSTAAGIARRFDETEGVGHDTANSFGDNVGVDMLTFYEVYVYQDVDRQMFKQVVWIAEGAKTPIRQPEKWETLFSPRLPGWPIHRLVFNPVPDDYPMAEAEVWQQIQEAVNWTMSKLVSFVSQNNQRWTIDTSRVENAEEAVNKILSGRSIEVIKVKEGARASDAIGAVQGTGVPQETVQLLGILTEYAERVTQLGRNQQSQGGVFRTATEAAAVDRATQIRSNERVDVMRDFLREDVRKLAAMIRAKATTEMVFRLAGDTGQVEWERFTPEDIAWEPDIDIEVDSFRELDEQQELAKWTMVFNMGSQLFQIMGPIVRLDLIFTELVKAARVPNPEILVGNLIGARQYQLLEVMQIILGTYIPAQPAEPHGEHIAALKLLQNSPIWPQFPPDVQAQILQHQAEHEAFLQQNRDEAQGRGQPSTLGQNPLDVLGNGNQQRQSSAYAREAQRTGGRDQQEFL